MWTCIVCLQFCWMLNRRSVHKTSRTRSTFSLVLIVVGRPERCSSATSSRSSLNGLCHFPDCDLEMQSYLKASCSIWNVSVAFFPTRTLWRIVVQANTPSHYVTKIENTLQAETRMSPHAVRSQLTIGWNESAYALQQFPTVIPCCHLSSRQNNIMLITFIMDHVQLFLPSRSISRFTRFKKRLENANLLINQPLRFYQILFLILSRVVIHFDTSRTLNIWDLVIVLISFLLLSIKL